jgi:hypothetical protein
MRCQYRNQVLRAVGPAGPTYSLFTLKDKKKLKNIYMKVIKIQKLDRPYEVLTTG